MRRLAAPSTNTTDTMEVYLSPTHGALTSPTYPRVLLLLLEQHLTPPPPLPLPHPPDAYSRTPSSPPHTVEAWLSYVRSTNSTETCGTLGRSIQETYFQTATPDAWPRASARSAVARQCRKAVCRSFGSQKITYSQSQPPYAQDYIRRYIGRAQADPARQTSWNLSHSRHFLQKILVKRPT
jgi:hypothetical protein